MSTRTLTPEFTPAIRSDLKLMQPSTTHSGSPIEPIRKGLPKQTSSLCPECGKLIDAVKFEEDGKVWMDKKCDEHGDFRDLIFSDVKLYLKMEQWHFGDNRGVSNPAVKDATRCPDQCGLCSMHASHTALANLDLTNRCNLTCPVCFANANVQGYLYEPDLAHVRKMLQALRDERPVAGRVVQFSGGEPTIYPHWFEALSMAREMGFSHIQAATNGIEMADLEFTRKSKEAGLNTLYLQFDGVCDDIYKRTRGESLLAKKIQCIENCRKVGLKIVFVPTIVKGVNDHEVGAIIKLAIDNIDTVSGISFQPVAFCGRIAKHELLAKRYTLSDLAKGVAEQTGLTNTYDDWFPLACVTPFSKLMGAMRGEEVPTMSCHPHCSLGTYMFVDEKSRTAVPVTRFVDIGALLQDMYQLGDRKQGKNFVTKKITKSWTGVKAWSSLKRHFKPELAPPGLTFEKFIQTLQGFTDKKLGRDGMDGTYTYRTLLVAGMHFMDSYNYDVERVKRCLIHYAAPNGLLYPFCAYNAGPTFREKIERKYSVPWDPKSKTVTIEGTQA